MWFFWCCEGIRCCDLVRRWYVCRCFCAVKGECWGGERQPLRLVCFPAWSCVFFCRGRVFCLWRGSLPSMCRAPLLRPGKSVRSLFGVRIVFCFVWGVLVCRGKCFLSDALMARAAESRRESKVFCLVLDAEGVGCVVVVGGVFLLSVSCGTCTRGFGDFVVNLMRFFCSGVAGFLTGSLG